MKLLKVIFASAVVCFGVNAWTAEQPARLSGTWILDEAKSDPAPVPLMNLGPPTNMNAPGGGGGGGGFSGGGMRGGPAGEPMPGGFPGGSRGMPGGARRGGAGAQPFQQITTLSIEQTENEITFSSTLKGRDGKELPVMERYSLDRKETVEMIAMPNSPNQVKKTTKATLKNNRFQVIQRTFYPQGTNELKKEFSLSKDGKTLTLNLATTMVSFQTVQKLVYNRQ